MDHLGSAALANPDSGNHADWADKESFRGGELAKSSQVTGLI